MILLCTMSRSVLKMRKKIKLLPNEISLRPFVLLFLITLIGCSGSNAMPDDNEPEPIEMDYSYLPMGNGTTTPYMQGTFIDFWGKGNWSVASWDLHMKQMKETGIKTLMVQFTAYGDNVFFDSKNSYSTNIYPNALRDLLDAAQNNNIGVYVGLYFDDEYWDNATNTIVLKTHADKSKDLANEIWTKYKSKTSLKGWYITHEPAPYYYQTLEALNILKNNLVNPIANYCRNLSGKPVSMSAFFNEGLTPISPFKTFMSGLARCELDLLILQDGIGVHHASLNNIEAYYKAANESLYVDNSFEGAFWADIETFIETPKGSSKFLPESFNVVKEKLIIVDSYVSFIVTFQYHSDMNPFGPNGAEAKALRDDYLNYLN